MAVTEALTRPIGPLAAWQWGLVIGGGYLAYRFLKGGSSPSFSSGGGTVVGSTTGDNNSAGTDTGTGSIDTGTGGVTADQVQSMINDAVDAIGSIAQGPAGPAGPTGPAGPAGPSGPSGTVTGTGRIKLLLQQNIDLYDKSGKIVGSYKSGTPVWVIKTWSTIKGKTGWRYLVVAGKYTGDYFSVRAKNTIVSPAPVTAAVSEAAAMLPNQLSPTHAVSNAIPAPSTTVGNQAVLPISQGGQPIGSPTLSGQQVPANTLAV